MAITVARAASTRTFNFPATDDNVTLGDTPPANDGISRISSLSSNPTTDFANPATSVTAATLRLNDELAIQNRFCLNFAEKDVA